MTGDSKVFNITSAKKNNLSYTLINYGEEREHPYLLVISSDKGIQVKTMDVTDFKKFSPSIAEELILESEKYFEEEVDPYIDYLLRKYDVE